jgi:hypothetical protein
MRSTILADGVGFLVPSLLSISTSVSTLLATLLVPGAVHAAWLPYLAGPVKRVVATPNHIAAVRAGEVWVMGEDGRLLHRLAKPAAEEESGEHRLDLSERDRILDFLEVSEADRDTDYANDLLDDETTLAKRRMSRTDARPANPANDVAPVLAAASGQIWIANGRNLLRIDPEGRPVHALDRPAPIFGLVATREALLIGEGHRLTLVPGDTRTPRAIALGFSADKVALSSSARRIAWASGSIVTWSDGLSTDASNRTSGTSVDARPFRSFQAPAEIVDLAYCGEELIVSLRRSLLILAAEGKPQVRTRQIQAQRMFCPEEPQLPWLAWGPGLYLSTDQGRNWRALALPDAMEPLDAAVSAHHVWLATEAGLYASIDQGLPPATTVPTRQSRIQHQRAMGKATTSWTAWMPKVTLQGQAAFALGSQQWQALAFATFPLDSRTTHGLPIVTMTAVEDDAGETPVTRRNAYAVPPRDSDFPCLAQAKHKAVALAMAEPERARSYVTRAGHAAWLPELRFLVARRYGRSESLDLNTSSTTLASPLGIDTVNDIRYEARATWDLARLIFSPEELAAQSQAVHMAELRRDIETTVNRLYFERRRILVDSLGEHAAEAHRALRTAEIESELDAMSAGVFSTCLSGKP